MRLTWGLLVTLLACSDAGLQPVDSELDYVDDRLALSGRFCPSDPDEVVFPVKVLVVIDQSASLQCTDPGNARLAALNAAGSALDGLPNVQFGVIGFASWSREQDFTSDWSTASAALAPESGQGGPATDYQGALSVAHAVLEREMLRVGPAENARSRYVVLFFSDGVPEPRCRAGCEDGDSIPDSLYGVCNTTLEIPEDEYVGLRTPCPSYNQRPEILEGVSDIQELAEVHGVADLSFNTFLLFAPPEEVAAVCGDVSGFGYIREEAEPLLVSMAEQGGGTYRDVNTAAEIDLDFGYQSLRAPFALTDLFAINTSAVPTETGIEADSDGDGIADTEEFDRSLDPLLRDSDGDGFGDLIELRNLTRGFDPLDPTVPAWGCDDTEDRDGDGLLACEEAFLGTNPLLPDTDLDRLPDGLEFRFDLDPLVDDARVDHDVDGRNSGDELRAGTHPWVFDEEERALDVVQFAVDEASDGCYDWSATGITLVQPRSTDGTKGVNDVVLLAQESPTGLGGSRARHHSACVSARYLGPGFKSPRDGRISDVATDQFRELAVFDADLDCADHTVELP